MSSLRGVRLSQAFRALQGPFKVALSMVLLYWLALWLNWDMPKYGALAIALISLDTTGASLQKGTMRIVGTTVGLAVGLLGLSLFPQDRWLSLVYYASFLAFVGYRIQGSRYPYAWYVAGFLPTLVWATTYGDLGNAFHYATFRYLETTAGIVIYAMVSVAFWPQRAGKQLERQGDALWQEVRALVAMDCRRLKGGGLPVDAPAQRAKLAGTSSQFLTTLQAAHFDTPPVASKKRAWEMVRGNVRAIGDALELWRHGIEDCHRLELYQLLPELGLLPGKLDDRVARIADLWHSIWHQRAATTSSTVDDALLEPLQFRPDSGVYTDLSHQERAALLSFAHQARALDGTSRALLRTLRVLAGLAPANDLAIRTWPADLDRPARWDPRRLFTGLLPALSFFIGYLTWIHINPPTGPNVPNIAATFGLLVLLTPMRMLKLLPVFMLGIWGIVAPIYFLLMPRLSTAPELLMLVFVFTFVCRLLTGRLAPFGSVGLILFVMMTGISNTQHYSFTGLVDGALMMTLAIGIVAVVQTLLSPARSEVIILNTVQSFIRGCEGVTRGLVAKQASGRRLSKRHFRSIVLPAAAKLQTARKQLDPKRHPETTPELLQRLHDGVQEITQRLALVQFAHDAFMRHSAECSESIVAMEGEVSATVHRLFKQWSTVKLRDTMEQDPNSLPDLASGFEGQLDRLSITEDHASADARELTDLYTMLGSAKGLIEALVNTQGVINQIKWRQLTAPRF